ncbi:sporulation kinase E [Peptococcaceae bacterium CEB3]|nr:sporulation kinase E [Peptococcaceae bacterium CEB3]
MQFLRKVKEHLFPMQITKRVYASVVIVVMILVLFLACLLPWEYIQVRVAHRSKDLYYVASMLESRFPESVHDILADSQALGASPDEQARVLNKVLQPTIDHLSKYYPQMGLGYYSIRLDRVLAMGPHFSADDLKSVSHDNSCFLVYKTGRPEFSRQDPAPFKRRGPVLDVAYPIYRNGEIVGHAWANIGIGDIYRDVRGAIVLILLIGFGVLIMSLALAWNLFSRLRGGVQDFARALALDAQVPESLWPELTPVLEIVKKHTDQVFATCAKLQEEVAMREETEAELRQSEERFSKAFNASPSMMNIVRIVDWQIIDANESFFLMTGWSREEVIGRTAEELKIWADKEDVARLREESICNGSTRNLETTLLTKNERALTALVSAEMIELGQEVCILVVINDISERKQMEMEMLRLDRLNLLGEMAAGISHEVRNPLTTIRGFLQILKGKKDCQSYGEYFSLMIEELDRANAIISEFLSIGRNKVGERQTHNLNSIIEALTPLIQADAVGNDKSVVLDLENIPALLLNEKEIRQVVLNLARNGLEAMEAGGTLTIRTYATERNVVLAVADQGSGISPEHVEKLGTPFFTTKEQGTGLGLAVCYGIAARHQAEIMVDSDSRGTEFRVCFTLL